MGFSQGAHSRRPRSFPAGRRGLRDHRTRVGNPEGTRRRSSPPQSCREQCAGFDGRRRQVTARRAQHAVTRTVVSRELLARGIGTSWPRDARSAIAAALGEGIRGRPRARRFRARRRPVGRAAQGSKQGVHFSPSSQVESGSWDARAATAGRHCRQAAAFAAAERRARSERSLACVRPAEARRKHGLGRTEARIVRPGVPRARRANLAGTATKERTRPRRRSTREDFRRLFRPGDRTRACMRRCWCRRTGSRTERRAPRTRTLRVPEERRFLSTSGRHDDRQRPSAPPMARQVGAVNFPPLAMNVSGTHLPPARSRRTDRERRGHETT